MEINSLSPHPENAKIYGDTFDDNLLDKIRKVGILTPILISKDNRIISGHRRWECAKELGFETVPTMTFESEDENDILEAMIMANEQRERNNEQKAREYQALKVVEAERNKKNQGKRTDLLPNSSKSNPGDSRKTAAKKVGLAGSTADKAAEVVQIIDAMEQTGDSQKAEEIRGKLNKSVNSAYNSVKPIIAEKKETKEETKKAKYVVEDVSDKLSIIRSTNIAYKPTFNSTNDNINWAGWSWNPVTGCLHGCEYCYARAKAENPYYQDGFPTGFKPTFRPDRLSAPQNTTIPKDKQNIKGIKRVFVCSMADLFGDWVPSEWIQSVIDSCNENQKWDFLFLTKNPKRYLEFEFPLNCWLGATADTQKRADNAVKVFMDFKGLSGPDKDEHYNITFLSCEPLSERIEFEQYRDEYDNDIFHGDLDCLDLLIIGAMKGTEGTDRQPKWEWVENLIMQSITAGIHYLFKPNLTVRPSLYPSSIA
ncbi:MAG: DUF5131 family protein [Nitrospina sp.]|jgi:protein gp37/ParB-like chromosome segregation protein Spo0J|nr:DUF5131 family protein [Nitrospina sp.]